jgi:hypothetical protein
LSADLDGQGRGGIGPATQANRLASLQNRMVAEQIAEAGRIRQSRAAPKGRGEQQSHGAFHGVSSIYL